MNAIEKNIVDALPDANSAKVRVVFGDNPIRVGLSVVDESDINGILLAASSIGNFQGSELLPQDDGRTVVALEFFGGGLEYAPIKKLLLEDLEKKGFRKVRDFIFIDGSADLFGEVYLTTTDASDSVLALRKLLTEQYGFPFGAVAIHQVASVEALDPFFDESTNRNFTFAKPFTGLLLAGNVVGGEFVVPVAVEVVGGVVITAQAIEGSNQSLSTFWAKDEEGNLIPVGSLGTHGEEVTRADTE
jgi:hypothetical protein